MKKLILPIDVMMTVPITDIRHTLEEINRHRQVHAQMEEQNKLRAQRCYKYYGRYKKAR